ncbi:formate dehydrogenase accessory sulfurtransferase FdhD [Sphingomonas sp. CV7422]|uniref:formate dehydrogenase accessory sulfurtransferase FdhD n=1 Tax=Sphingomonas sp. CV7422 TaxID=3018036 RepID=UPI0022FE0840|nr:formate dehydrogenase accessory sulfurtransferase FdhD [Sphingomonas sp. CV7422]
MSGARQEAVHVLRPDGSIDAATRAMAIEAPVAIEVDGLGYAVMMMTPRDLAAFATGFMLTERLADTRGDILDIDVFEAPAGWIVRVALAERCRGRIADRIRHRTSDTSCGLCGIASLEQLVRPVARRPEATRVAPAAIFHALGLVRDSQHLNRSTGAVHAAAACGVDGAILALCEDVGRHNALDKLIGLGIDAAFTLVTSRISFEMVDKSLVAGTPLLVGISAATSLGIDHARAHGLTLVALARSDALLLLNDPGAVFA